MTGPRTRLAPTPSGFLHAGNALNFLITHQLAREAGGTILLRIDDLDVDRVRPEYVEDIFESLDQLGIGWDMGPRSVTDLKRNWSQSLRVGRAERLLDLLKDSGQLYACSCSRKRIIDCSCRELNLPFHTTGSLWRLRIPEPCDVTFRTWPDGRRSVDLRKVMRDPVLRQRNGSPAYQVMSLADDVDFGIALIVRGDDLLPSTACQVYLAKLLGLTTFQDARFLHHALITDADGQKLSKSAGAGSSRATRLTASASADLRAQAIEILAGLRAQGL